MSEEPASGMTLTFERLVFIFYSWLCHLHSKISFIRQGYLLGTLGGLQFCTS